MTSNRSTRMQELEVADTFIKGVDTFERSNDGTDPGYEGQLWLWYDSTAGRLRLQIYSVTKGEWTEIGMTDFYLEVAKGNVTGHVSVNKFGRSVNVDSGVATDVWDAAAQPIWLAPTAARVHTIVSTSDLDGKTAAPSSVGARTIQIYGLADWDSAETSETVTMDGTTGVTAGSYVIIHRMKVLTKGSTSANVGTITATAASDATVTAQIFPLQGQTQLAIYGVPSTQTYYMTSLGAAMNRAGGAAAIADARLLVNPEPADEILNYIVKHTWGMQTVGTSATPIPFVPPKKIDGPAIIKVQAEGSANDLDVSAWFDGVVVTN